MKKVIIALALGLGLSLTVAVPAYAQPDPTYGDEYDFDPPMSDDPEHQDDWYYDCCTTVLPDKCPDCAPKNPPTKNGGKKKKQGKKKQTACVTRKEYRRIVDWSPSNDNGTHIKRVHEIFDTRGRLLSGGNDMYRKYRVCRSWGGPGSSVEIWYDNYSSDKPGYRVFGKDFYVTPRR